MESSLSRRSLLPPSLARRSSIRRSQFSLSKAPLADASLERADGLTLRLGDKVIINASPQEVKRLSKGHGGWKDSMAPYSYKLGIIHRFTVAGDVRVKFGLLDESIRFTFHPDVLQVIYLPGDLIQTSANMSDIRREQSRRVGCSQIPSLVDISSKDASVTAVSDDQLSVFAAIDAKTYWLSIRCIRLLTSNRELLVKMINQVHPMHSPRTATSSKDCSQCKLNDFWKTMYHDLLELHTCSICFEEKKNIIFGCGHGSCKTCSLSLSDCPMCRKPISTKIEMF